MIETHAAAHRKSISIIMRKDIYLFSFTVGHSRHANAPDYFPPFTYAKLPSRLGCP